MLFLAYSAWATTQELKQFEIFPSKQKLGTALRETVYSHAIRGRDDEAARRWEEFQRRSLSEKRTEVQ